MYTSDSKMLDARAEWLLEKQENTGIQTSNLHKIHFLRMKVFGSSATY